MREFGGERAVIRFRKVLPHYLKGVRGARAARGALCRERSAAAVLRVVSGILDPGQSPPASTSSGTGSMERHSR